MGSASVDESSLQGVLRVLRRRLWIVLACLVLVPLIALAIALSQDKQYTASATLFFRTPSLNTAPQGTLVPAPDPDRLAATNLTLASLRPVAEGAARELGRGADTDDIVDKIEIFSDGESDVARVQATDEDAEFAARLANVYAEQYVNFRRERDQATVTRQMLPIRAELRSLSPAERAGRRGRALGRRLADLTATRDLQTGNTEIVEQAEPPSDPSSPRPVRNVAIGAVLGLLLGLALASLIDLLDRRLRDEGEIEGLFDLPVLGSIPESRDLRTEWRSPPHPGAADLEAFRMVYVSLRYFPVAGRVKSALFTSAVAAEGKSTVAWHLAVAAASTGVRVLFVEADLRHAGAGTVLAGNRNRGLSLVLVGQPIAEHTMSPADLGDPEGLPPTLAVLPAGPPPPNPTKLLASDAMKSLLERCEEEYDLVVIDTPPLTGVPDAVPLVKLVDGVVPVVRVGKTTRGDARALQRLLRELDAPLLGLVINASRRSAFAGYYSYGPEPAAGVDWGALEDAAARAEPGPVPSPPADTAGDAPPASAAQPTQRAPVGLGARGSDEAAERPVSTPRAAGAMHGNGAAPPLTERPTQQRQQAVPRPAQHQPPAAQPPAPPEQGQGTRPLARGLSAAARLTRWARDSRTRR